MEAFGKQLFLLLHGQPHYIVPLFQRPYSWDKENWESLWADILETYEMGTDARHFLGPIVMMSFGASPGGVTRFTLIDGQQRITTISLLLTALHDATKDSIPHLADKIRRQYLINEWGTNLEQYKLLPTQADRASYFAILDKRPQDAPNSQIKRAYKHFYDLLTDESPDGPELDFVKLEQVITMGLELVVIEVKATENEHRIFESLNAKGMPLTQADLLRNYVFMNISAAHQQDTYDTLWAPMQERLRSGTKVKQQNKDLETFLWYELLSTGDYVYVREGDAYQTWKTRLEKSTEEELIAEVRTLHVHSQFYKHMISPDSEPKPDPAIARGLSRLNRWGGMAVYPYLLFLWREYKAGNVDAKGFAEITTMLESFLVRRAFSFIPTQGLNRQFIRLSQQLPPGLNLVEATRQVLSEPFRRWPQDEDFLAAFQSYPLYVNSKPNQRRLIIESLEESYPNKERPPLSSFPQLTIEHIMPQTLTQEWMDDLGSNFHQVHNKLLHVPGNLTLTSFNGELGNMPFSKKKAVLAQSLLEMNRGIVNQASWTEKEIRERGQRLAERAVKLWPGPKSLD